MEQHDLAIRQFGSTARQYLTSSVHARGDDLDRLAALAQRPPVSNALDLGCGAGHASFALARGGAKRIVAYDLATGMLDVVQAEAIARGHTQIETRAGRAENLPFADASFDLVVTRYSAHHWLDVRRAVGEVARILAPGGSLVVIDVLAPEHPLMDTVLQTVEILRDASHVRDYRESEWRSMLAAANFSEPGVHRWKLPMEFAGWVTRIGTSAPRIDALTIVLDQLPSEARDYFAVSQDRSFSIDAGWFEVRLPRRDAVT
ncbi:MAG: putative SAM-dependent methyltransferase [Gammaproteobacteria bacterium]|nr:putative SAM-dependent methyltransferase [Gammaproteobacteria bacterium]